MARDSITVALWFAVGWTVGNAGVALIGMPWPLAVVVALTFAVAAGRATQRRAQR